MSTKKRLVATLLGVMLLFMGFLLGTNYQTYVYRSTAYEMPLQITEEAGSDKDMLTLVNEERARNGLPPLARNTTLDSSALVRAKEIADSNLFEHARPNGTEFATAIYALGNFPSVGENLAKCGRSNQDAMERWITSETHHLNMLGRLNSNNDWGKVGYAQVWDNDLRCSVDVMHFGR